MPSYQQLSSTRTTEPDPVALLASLRAIEPSAATWHDGNIYHVKTAAPLTAPQLASMQTAIDTAPELTPQRAAQNEIDRWPIAQRALLLALIDQLNVLRSKLSPPLGAITPAQALQAVRDKAATL
jgi:hypothetical protein